MGFKNFGTNQNPTAAFSSSRAPNRRFRFNIPFTSESLVETTNCVNAIPCTGPSRTEKSNGLPLKPLCQISSFIWGKTARSHDYFHRRGTKSSHEHFKAWRKRATVVMSRLISPASTRRTLRAFMSASSANRSCVIPSEERIRRMLPPNDEIKVVFQIVLSGNRSGSAAHSLFRAPIGIWNDGDFTVAYAWDVGVKVFL